MRLLLTGLGTCFLSVCWSHAEANLLPMQISICLTQHAKSNSTEYDVCRLGLVDLKSVREIWILVLRCLETHFQSWSRSRSSSRCQRLDSNTTCF